ncbi:hypothetical protein Lal_00029507 [Lupinus albus]|nr:hypothetical protein Lal_00029507 [Lupinus albus]
MKLKSKSTNQILGNGDIINPNSTQSDPLTEFLLLNIINQLLSTNTHISFGNQNLHRKSLLLLGDSSKTESQLRMLFLGGGFLQPMEVEYYALFAMSIHNPLIIFSLHVI